VRDPPRCRGAPARGGRGRRGAHAGRPGGGRGARPAALPCAVAGADRAGPARGGLRQQGFRGRRRRLLPGVGAFPGPVVPPRDGGRLRLHRTPLREQAAGGAARGGSVTARGASPGGRRPAPRRGAEESGPAETARTGPGAGQTNQAVCLSRPNSLQKRTFGIFPGVRSEIPDGRSISEGKPMSVENPPGLDLRRLRAHLDEVRPGLVTGPLTGELIEGGRSNLTYSVTDGATRWVVRRPPLGHVLPTAHDMAREYRVISALADTPVPVPGTVTLCEDETVIGARFYVMDFVTGVPLRRAEQLAPRGPERTRDIALRLIDTLAALHSVDPADVGLGDFGRPEGFLERQVRRWGKQLDASRSRDLPGIDELRARLA